MDIRPLIRRSALALLVISALCLPATAGQNRAKPIQTRTRRVALFKNGLAFFTLEGNLPTDTSGPVSFGPFLAPTHGTFWVAYSKGTPLKDMVARETTVTEPTAAVNLHELLRANVGKRVRLYFTAEKMEPVSGTLISVADDRIDPPPRPYIPGPSAENRRTRPPHEQGRLALISTSSGIVAVDPRQVQRVDFPGQEANESFPRKSEAVELVARLEKPASERKVTVSYLAKGLTWSPSYMVDIPEDDGKARLAAKALIVNDAADLDDVQAELVTGYPHLRFADVVSPVARKESLSQFLDSLRRGESEEARRREAEVMRQRVTFGMGIGGAGGALPEYGSAAEGRVAEDLFLYPLGTISLKKDETGYYPLFTESVPYEHIYQWDIPDYINEDQRIPPHRREEDQPEQEVWHSLRLENTSDVPWTTAPAETVQDGQILGQDTLAYTPPGGEQTLRITQAVGVKAEEAEIEVSRERNATEYYGYPYDRVTVEGRLAVKSFKEKPITLEITKTLSGELKASKPEAEVTKQARGLEAINPLLELTWTVELEPGEREELSYTYDVLARR